MVVGHSWLQEKGNPQNLFYCIGSKGGVTKL